jgi:hypothetical protein
MKLIDLTPSCHSKEHPVKFLFRANRPSRADFLALAGFATVYLGIMLTLFLV